MQTSVLHDICMTFALRHANVMQQWGDICVHTKLFKATKHLNFDFAEFVSNVKALSDMDRTTRRPEECWDARTHIYIYIYICIYI